MAGLRSYSCSLADKLRQAAESKVNKFGFVADVCGAPTFDKAGFAPEGQAFFPSDGKCSTKS